MTTNTDSESNHKKDQIIKWRCECGKVSGHLKDPSIPRILLTCHCDGCSASCAYLESKFPQFPHPQLSSTGGVVAYITPKAFTFIDQGCFDYIAHLKYGTEYGSASRFYAKCCGQYLFGGKSTSMVPAHNISKSLFRDDAEIAKLNIITEEGKPGGYQVFASQKALAVTCPNKNYSSKNGKVVRGSIHWPFLMKMPMKMMGLAFLKAQVQKPSAFDMLVKNVGPEVVPTEHAVNPERSSSNGIR